MQTPTLSLAVRSPDLEDLIEKARGYIHAAKAPATLRAYRSDFEDFTRFCQEHHLAHLPATPTTVALYIAERADSLRSATITRRLTSITKGHRAAGFEESPSSSHHFVVSETLKGIRRLIGTAQEGKAPLLTSDIRRIVASCPETLSGLRDKALVLVGFAGAFRRSELAAIDFTHLSFTEDGLIIDPHHPRGYRELRSNGEMRKLLDRKIAEQNGLCALCKERFTEYGDVVPDHINPRGMGGAWRDDHPDNIQAVHWWCNGEQGSSRG